MLSHYYLMLLMLSHYLDETVLVVWQMYQLHIK